MTLAVGYVTFRAAAGRRSPLSAPGAGMLPVRVTGLISGYRNGKRARELRAEIRVTPTDPAAGPPPIDLVWQTVRSGPTGIRLIPGVTAMILGTAYPVTGARPGWPESITKPFAGWRWSGFAGTAFRIPDAESCYT